MQARRLAQKVVLTQDQSRKLPRPPAAAYDSVVESRRGAAALRWAKMGGTMGIRFLCPNGHKLNVKSFQAGKRGICPHCGARFTIPSESTLPESDKAPAPRRYVEEAEVVAEQPPEQAMEQAAEQAAEQAPERVELPFGEQVDVHVDPPVVPPTPTPQKIDPLAEAPGASWYVSPPGGGQFGPANAALMRTWIAEGRVTADSLVWREGWDDWAEASTVLPQLASPEAAYLPAPQPADTLPAPSITISESVRGTARGAVGRPRRRAAGRLSTRDKTFRWVGILAVLVVALLLLFIWVVNRS